MSLRFLVMPLLLLFAGCGAFSRQAGQVVATAAAHQSADLIETCVTSAVGPCVRELGAGENFIGCLDRRGAECERQIATGLLGVLASWLGHVLVAQLQPGAPALPDVPRARTVSCVQAIDEDAERGRCIADGEPGERCLVSAVAECHRHNGGPAARILLTAGR